MSDLNDLIHTNAHNAYAIGVKTEQERIIKGLEGYFELTQEPNEDGTSSDNLEWDKGFQAAIAIVKGMRK